jgi:bacterial/archaeal transporter family-2 protein
MKNLKGAVSRKEIPVWTLFAGMLGGSFVAVQTQIVPIIGVAIYSVASIAGQTAASLIVDRIGLTGGGKKQITVRRVAAAAVTVLAVLVSVLDRIEAAEFIALCSDIRLFCWRNSRSATSTKWSDK